MKELLQKIKNKNLFFLFVSTLALTIFTIVLIRAATTAITWDEAYTYVVYARDFSINQLIDIPSNYANNHIINTIMIAVLDNLCNIEYNEFIIRLPNIIMLMFYFIGSYKISKEEKHKFLLFTGLVLNYYVMEFFGLGRGYGIAASLVIWMCYFFKKAVNNNYNDSNIFISIILGILACYANTVSILALFSICVIYLIELIKRKDLIQFIKRNIIKILPLVVLLIYIIVYHFLVTGGDKPVFGEENGISFLGFLKRNFVWMFVENPVINIIVSVIGLAWIVISSILFRKEISKNKFFKTLLILVVSLILPFMVLNKPFLLERCLIPLWPVLVLGIVECYTIWTNKINAKASKILTFFIILILFFAFAIRIDVTSTRTWKNNYPVKEVITRALCEQRKLTKEEYEENKGYYGLTFYQQKIFLKYGYNIFPEM